MSNRLKHNLASITVYFLFTFVLLILVGQWYDPKALPISVLIGFLFGQLNDINTQLRQLNGEKFPELEENDDNEKT